MSTTALDSKVLVLNQGMAPVNVTTGFDAICKLFKGEAQAVVDYQFYDFDEWVVCWEDAVKESKHMEAKIVRSQTLCIAVPEIIRLKNYKKFLFRRPKLSRAALFRRDDDTCQYCGRQKSKKDLNIDHVFPQSRGGKNSWKNLVVSCIPCNNRKKDKTPKEAGMPLIREPYMPHWAALKNGFSTKNTPRSWEDFLGTMYWNTELKD
jgi:5-methylcytosine-specific restriction endonuclease McrA